MNHIRLSAPIIRTPRVMQIEGMFDIAAEEKSVTIIPAAIPDLDAQEWNIGLIYGASGSGKSTVATALFGESLRAIETLQWQHDSAVIDNFPAGMSIKEIVDLLSNVGFSSPPAWLRPFQSLSNGEQFRVTMARVIAEQTKIAVIDEFTSVVDRTVAKIGSHAIAKTVRKRGSKFVAVSCHADIIEWLRPDWTYQPATGTFRWECLQPRPTISLRIIRCNSSAWQHFARYHYLSNEMNRSSAVFVALVDEQPAALASILSFPHPKLKNAWRMSRIVVVPDFQGIGIAGHFADVLGGAYKADGRSLTAGTSHPALIATLNKRPTWSMIRKPSRISAGSATAIHGFGTSSNRITASFRYCGPERQEAVKLLRV